MLLAKHEINRKLLHLLALLLPAGIFFLTEGLGVSDWAPPIILALLLSGSVVIEILRFNEAGTRKIFNNYFGSMLRDEETKKITGSTYIIGSAFICSILFRTAPHISFISLSLFILGDAAAAIVGQSIGRIKIGNKTLEGSLACFILCLVMFFIVFPKIPFLLDSWNGYVPIWSIFIISFAITFFELLPLKLTGKIIINDNLAVPVIAGLIMKYLPFV